MAPSSSSSSIVIPLILVWFSAQPLTSASLTPYAATEFVTQSCSLTMYPPFCYKMLSPCNEEIDGEEAILVQKCLNLTNTMASSTLNYIRWLINKGGLEGNADGALGDCVANMKTSIGELKDTIAELGSYVSSSERQDMHWHISNMQTWVSAVLTDDTTCSDGLENLSVGSLKPRVNSLANMLSITLTFINRLDS